MTKMLSPTGGVISPISTTTTMRMPYHTESYPSAVATGRNTGTVTKMIATASSTQPRMI